MKNGSILCAAALALVLTSLRAPEASAGDAAPNTGAVRDRISADIAAGLAHSPVAPAPKSLTSRPVSLRALPPIASAATVVAPTAAEPASAPADTTPDGEWNELLAGNRRFVADHPRGHARERGEPAAVQHPHAIVLGCSDSRVSPDVVFDPQPGSLFVVRTAGNIVDPVALGSIEYAVEHLHAHLLVVLGHTSCSEVSAAAAGGESVSTFSQAIVDRIRPTVQRLANCFEGDELVERGVIANARQAAADALANSALLRGAVAKGDLKVVSAVYDLRTGVVTAVSAPAATAAAQAPAR